MYRHSVGLTALALLVLAGFGLLSTDFRTAGGVCARIGMGLGAVWLALPRDDRPVPLWMLGLAVLIIVAIMKVPGPLRLWLVAALPLIILLMWPHFVQLYRRLRS